MKWEGKVCLITGASSGFGFETAKLVGELGATVIAVARREERLQSLVKQLGGKPHSQIVSDVSDLEQIRRMKTTVRRRTRHVDVLINNAGVRTSGPFLKVSSESMEQVIRTNLLGPIWATKELLPLLEAAPKSNRTPVVVNIASIAGRIAIPRAADYAASKFGLVGFSQSVWPELRKLKIRTMMVNPGFSETEGFPMRQVRANRLVSWVVMDAERVARAIVRGIERGAFEVRVQWWMHLAYHGSVTLGPVWRMMAGQLRDRIRADF
jgi:short-subunit dehydrogenase